jgi:putative hydrolase of the HAD superfamily
LKISVSAFHDAMVAVAARNGTSDVMAPLDVPLITQEEWERQMEEALARLGSRADLTGFPALWFGGRPVNAAWLEVLERLRAGGVRLGLLSNMPPAWDAHWRAMVSPTLFDHVVLSHEIGVRKPERGMFDHAASVAGVSPEECVLVDDLAANCRAAQEHGWSAVPFVDASNAAARLAALGVCP